MVPLDLAFYLQRKEIIITRVTKAIENHRGYDRTFSRKRNYCTALLNAACDEKLMCHRMLLQNSLICSIIFSPGFV